LKCPGGAFADVDIVMSFTGRPVREILLVFEVCRICGERCGI
jgi:hypothetical protein